jgi:hypothetical protein
MQFNKSACILLAPVRHNVFATVVVSEVGKQVECIVCMLRCDTANCGATALLRCMLLAGMACGYSGSHVQLRASHTCLIQLYTFSLQLHTIARACQVRTVGEGKASKVISTPAQCPVDNDWSPYAACFWCIAPVWLPQRVPRLCESADIPVPHTSPCFLSCACGARSCGFYVCGCPPEGDSGPTRPGPVPVTVVPIPATLTPIEPLNTTAVTDVSVNASASAMAVAALP